MDAALQVCDLSPVLRESKITSKDVTAFMIDGLFSEEECNQLIKLTEEKGYEKALVNVGFGRQKLMEDVRKCERCIIDDPEMGKQFWEKIQKFVPMEFKGQKAVGMNERMRFLRYHKGDYFKPHMDGSYVRPDGSEMSLITFFLFLSQDCKGGASTFLSVDERKKVPCIPKTGRLILFEHAIYHEGSLLEDGQKYALRTDVMYCKKK